MSTTTRRIVAGVSGLAATSFLASCAKDAPQDTWQPKGSNAKIIDDLQQPVFAIAGVVGVIVFCVVVYCIIKFRDRGQAMPEQTHGKPALEIGMTILPALILAGVGVFTFRTVFDLSKTSDTQMVVGIRLPSTTRTRYHSSHHYLWANGHSCWYKSASA